MIVIKNLNKVYKTNNTEVVALKNINLTINDGEIYGIMGLSGAGKSSLIRCINMLEKPTSGSIRINNIEMTSLKQQELRSMRKKIGMIFQHFNLLTNSTVYENIAFPLKIAKTNKHDIEKRVNELLEVVELEDKKDAYPSQLSGGQKQRVGIARALANKPNIILSDEATSALDPKTTDSILSLLKNINKEYGITIVVITHEMAVIRNVCNKVAVLENGEIIEEGNVLDIFSNPSTKTSKRFLKDMIAYLPHDVLIDDNNPNEEILRLSFIGKSSNEPLISHMIKKFDVDVNIISGNIERIQESNIGNLLIKLTGESDAIKNSINFLSENGLRIEVLKNGIV